MKIKYLDGIRGISCLWVVFVHCFIWVGWDFGVNHIPNAKIAVDVFMVLSGYLMVLLYGNSPDIRTFYWRRFLRIAPLYYATVLLVFALGTWYQDAVAWQLTYLGWGDGGHHNPYLQPRNWQNLLAHLTLTFGMFPQYANSLNLPDWSIGSEVQFYALFPFLLRWVKRSPVAVTVGLVALAVLLRMSHVFPSEPSLFFLKAPQYLIGMLTAGALHHRWRTLWLAGTVATIQSEYWQQPGILLFVVCLLAIAHRSSEAKALADRYLGNKFMAFLATTSYGVYLLHGFCIIGYSRLLDSNWYYSQPKAFHGIATLVLTLVTVYPIAWLSYQWIELPFLRMGRSNPAKSVREEVVNA